MLVGSNQVSAINCSFLSMRRTQPQVRSVGEFRLVVEGKVADLINSPGPSDQPTQKSHLSLNDASTNIVQGKPIRPVTSGNFCCAARVRTPFHRKGVISYGVWIVSQEGGHTSIAGSISYSDATRLAEAIEKIRFSRPNVSGMIGCNRSSKVISRLIMASSLLDGAFEELSKCMLGWRV